jgi:hypothetical protein
MTQEHELELIELGKRMFNGIKAHWTGEDLVQIYGIYNKIHGTNEVDTGCGSCRRNHINSVRNMYMALVKTNPVQ